jgi:UDP-N-acetyl-D-glucosamine dehydrogenase
MSMYADRLAGRIQDRTAEVAVVGLGYVGLALGVEFAKAGHRVIGVDVSGERVAAVRAGRSYIVDVTSEEVAELIAMGRLAATTDTAAIAGADVVIICVPTPLRKTKEPDISHVLAAAAMIEANARPGQLVILESTTYPGTTEELLLPALERRGFRLGEDAFLAFSPERVDPGNPKFKTRDIPKVVGGVTPTCTRLAQLLYEQIISEVIPVSGPRAAEMAKLLENTFRSVNIALANEIAHICRTLGVDTWEVIRAAATKPFGFMPFYPGPGIGGHCIPIDPFYLAWKSRLNGYEAKFISLADEINRAMPQQVLRLVIEALNDAGKCVRGSRVLGLGVAYKRDVNDIRESPALEILEGLLHRGAIVAYHDPYVPSLTVNGTTLRHHPLTEDLVRSQDCVLIVTDHSTVDYAWVAQHAALIVDTRNATSRSGLPAAISPARIVRL